jgi:hypothetical protein
MDTTRYIRKTYPMAWAIVEDETTGELREATPEELVELGLTGPKFEARMEAMIEGYEE